MLGSKLRAEFPLLANNEVVYLDSAATALKPNCVVNAVVNILTEKTGNVHRSVHRLGDLATEAYESARAKVANFLNAETHEVVFLRNTTEALNLVGSCWPGEGRRIVSLADHHSNLLPWKDQTHFLAPQPDGSLDVRKLSSELSKEPNSLVSLTHVSNVTGHQTDMKNLAELCHEHNSILVVDAAQSVPHTEIDVLDLDCDFLAFSGHKIGAPTGVGVLYGKAEHLEKLGWYLRGGSTVEEVHRDSVVPKDVPWRLEAGTPPIEAVVGLAAAIGFMQDIGLEAIYRHQLDLIKHAKQLIREELPQMRILEAEDLPHTGPISMVQRNVSPHLIARGLSDAYSTFVRSGFHCAQPLHEFMGVPASLRISFGAFNTRTEIEQTVAAIARLLEVS